MARSRRYIISYTGNMGNCMLQVMIARALMRRLGEEGEIFAAEQRILDRLEPWRLPITLRTDLPENRFVISKRVRSIARTARSIQQADADDIEIATCNLLTTEYPGREDMQALFVPPPGLELPAFGPNDLVINVRGGAILRGIHRDYVVPPPSFYRALVVETGLRPVFMGQVGDDAYSRSLREMFPGAAFLPSVSPIVDFEALRSARNVVACVSTFSMLACWLGRAEQVFMPLLGLFSPFQRKDSLHAPLDDPRYRFFLFPLFYMEPIDQIIHRVEPCLQGWREVSAPMLRSMMTSLPRIRPTLEQSLAVFDAEAYLRRYPDVARAVEAGTTPGARQHFRDIGFGEGRDPCEVDEPWYSKAYPQAAWEVGNGEFASLAQHYAAVGATRRYRPRPATR